jgi:signal transduction histidine kinase
MSAFDGPAKEFGESDLVQLGQIINSPLNLDQVLNRAMDQIIQVTQAERGFLMLVDQDGELEFKVARNVDRQTIEGSAFSISLSIVRSVAEQGQPVITTNAQSDPRFSIEDSVVNYQLRSILCVPLKLKEKVTGVIYTDNRIKAGNFSKRHLDLLTVFANQAAIAIENARLYEETEQRAKTLAVLALQNAQLYAETTNALARERRLNDVARIVSAALDLPTILESVTHLAAGLIDADLALMALFDSRSDALADFCCTNYSGKAGLEPPSDVKAVMTHILVQGEPVLLSDGEPVPEMLRHWLDAGVRTFLATPIIVGSEHVGVLALFSYDAQKRFNDRDVALIESVGRQAGVAIQNARLFTAERRQLKELTALHAVATAGAEATEQDELIERITQIIGDALYPDSFGILLLDEQAGVLRAHPSYWTPLGHREFVFPLGKGICSRVVETGEAWRVPDVTLEPSYIDAGEGTQSELCVPIKIGEQVVGVVNAESALPDAFSESDERLLTTVAGQMATALEKLELWESERRRRREAETLREATAALTSALELGPVLDAILNHLQQVVPYSSATVFLLQNKRARAVAAKGLPDLTQVMDHDYPVQSALFRELQSTQQPLCLADAQADPRFQNWGGVDYVRGWIGVPLIVRDKVIGFLTIDSRQVAAYGDAEAALAFAFANQAAVAIENARMFAQEQDRAEALAKALAQQKELDRLKDEFIQNASHELRTPLAIIRSYAELLESGVLGELESSQREPIAIIAERSRMLATLVQDLGAILEAETQEAGEALRREAVDLTDLLHSMMVHFRARAEQQALTLVSDLGPRSLVVWGNATQLQRMLDNLIDNAFKFTPSGGRIDVRLQGDGEQAVLEVSDTGIGIAADQFERIFERFYQVDGSSTRRYGGTGLGLALVRKIAENHKGQITVESVLDQGSTFRVALPLKEEA